MHLSFFLSIYRSIYLSVYLSIYLSIDLSIYLAIYLSIDLAVSLSVYLSISLSICLSVCRSIYLPVYLPIYLSISLSLSLSPSLSLSVCLSIPLYSKTEIIRDVCIFLNLITSKTKQFCETSSIFELDNIKNKAILRDFFSFWTWQHQKQSNSARLPWKMESKVQRWQPRTIVFCDFSTPPI